MNAFSCPNCQFPFDQAERLPKVLPICGHNICLPCLRDVLTEHGDSPRCPFDDIRIEITDLNQFPTNLTIFLLMLLAPPQNQQDQPQDSDSDHLSQNEAQESDKEGEKNEEIAVNEAEPYPERVYSLLEKGEKALLDTVRDKFANMRQLLREREEELWSETGIFFANERANADIRSQKEAKLRDTYQAYIADLSAEQMNQRFFNALEENVEQFTTKKEYEELAKRTGEVVDRLSQTLDHLESTAAPIIEKFEPVFISDEPVEEEKEVSLSSNKAAGPKISRVIDLMKFESQGEWLRITYKGAPKENSEDIKLIKGCNWEEIRSLKLDFSKTCLSEAMIRVIFYAWEELGKVSELKMDLSHKEFSDKELVVFCSDDRWATKDLQTFDINLKGCNVGDEGFTKLAESIKKLKDIKHLKINLRSTKITDESMDVFADALSEIKGLETFQFSFAGTAAKSIRTSKFGSSVKEYLKKVKVFSMDLREVNIEQFYLRLFLGKFALEIVDSYTLNLAGLGIEDYMLDSLFEVLDNISSIKHFSLNLSRNLISDKGLKWFAQNVVAAMVRLESFTLYLSETPISDSGVCEILNVIKKNMNNLKGFTLSLNQTKVTDACIKLLATFPKSFMDNIETFTIELSKTQITDTGVIRLCENVKGSLGRIKRFTLNLVNTKVTDKGLRALIQTDVFMKEGLEQLALGLFGTNITNDSATELFKSIRGKNLKTMTIDVGNTAVSDKSLEEFTVHTLPFLGNVETFTLGLSGSHVSDISVVGLCKYMGDVMKNLRKLVIGLRQTLVTDVGIGTLLSCLEAIKTLENFDVDISETRVRAEVIDAIKKYRKDIRLL